MLPAHEGRGPSDSLTSLMYENHSNNKKPLK